MDRAGKALVQSHPFLSVRVDRKIARGWIHSCLSVAINLVGTGNQGGWITRTTALFDDVQGLTVNLLNHIQHFPHAVTVAITAVQNL